jgi:hypothetical protein
MTSCCDLTGRLVEHTPVEALRPVGIAVPPLVKTVVELAVRRLNATGTGGSDDFAIVSR